MASGSGEVLSSLRGKIIELPESKEKEEWTPFNGDMHMQGIKVRYHTRLSILYLNQHRSL